MYFSKTFIKIKKCGNSRKGKSKFQPLKLCGEDYCDVCAKPLTDWLVEETSNFYHQSPQIFLTTIILPPTYSYKDGEEHTIKALRLIAEHDIIGIGAYEYANYKDSYCTDAFAKVGDLFENNIDRKYWRGIPHIHFITDRKFPILAKEIFVIKDQVDEKELGKGNYSSQTIKESIVKTVSYFRKRLRLSEASWFKHVSGSQLVFKLNDRKCYRGNEKVWLEMRDNNTSETSKQGGSNVQSCLCDKDYSSTSSSLLYTNAVTNNNLQHRRDIQTLEQKLKIHLLSQAARQAEKALT